MKDQYTILLLEDALHDIENIKDAGILKSVRAKINQLKDNPQAQGKPLRRELKGHYRIKVRNRYRIVYRVAVLEKQVVVVIIGIRKEGDKRDIYEIARKRLT